MGFLRRLFGSKPAEPPPPELRVRSSGTSIVISFGDDDEDEDEPPRPEVERRDLRAERLPDGFRHLIQGGSIDVVGESQYRAAIERAVGQRPEGHRDVVDAALVWEPSNPYDENAMAVQIEGQTCGYLPREVAKRYRPVMEWSRDEGFVPVVRGDVGGGWRQADGSWADFGIRVYVASPRKLLGREVVPATTHPWVGQMVVFTGTSRYALDGVPLDRDWSEQIAVAAGMTVWPRITKKVQVLVDCDPTGASGKERKAADYGITVVKEAEFWTTLGLAIEELDEG